MKQTVGIRFSEYGQVHIFTYRIPDEGPLLTPATGVMAMGEHGLSFGRVIWQHLESPETEKRKAAEARAEQEKHNTYAPLLDLPEASPCASPHVSTCTSSLPGLVEPNENSLSPGTQEDPALPLPEAAALSAQETAEAKNFAGAEEQAGLTQEGNEAQQDSPPPPSPLSPDSATLRCATEAELATAMENEKLSREAHTFCRHCISDRHLDMKLVDVETLYDRSKMIFYFTAPTRIDFRELVKDLVRQYRTRIELRQIGVRHETQMLGALGNCGMVCCCRRYLRKFAPVTIKMAKEQNLFLNPAKISGICGRLLCCLSYEQENYDAFHRSCPKLGKRYQTLNGPMRVLRGNMFRNSVIVLPDGGQELEITLEEWKELNPHRSESTAAPLPRENRPGPGFMVVSASPDTLDADLADLGDLNDLGDLTEKTQDTPGKKHEAPLAAKNPRKPTPRPAPPLARPPKEPGKDQDANQNPPAKEAGPRYPHTAAGYSKRKRKRKAGPGRPDPLL